MPSFARVGCLIGTLMLAAFGRMDAQTQPVCPDIQPVQCIRFEGNTVIASDELLRVAGVRPDETLSTQTLSDAVNRIQQAYTERGYVADFVYYEIQGEQSPRALVFHIRELRVGEIQISGLTKTADATVRNFIQINPGDVYSSRTVGEAVNRLSDLGIFEKIEVYLREGKEPGLAKLVFEVAEAKTRRVDLGGTYAPQGELILQVAYTESNFRGRSEQLTANLNIGSLQSKLSGGIGWYTPIVGGNPNRTFGFRAFSDVLFRFSNDLVNNPDTGRYFERRSGVRATMNDYRSRGRTLTYGFRYANTSVTNYPFPFISPDAPSPDGWVGMASAAYVQDRRLRLVFPVAGTYFSAALEPGYSGPSSGQSGLIGKIQADQRWLLPLQKITQEALAESNPKPVRAFVVRLNAGTSVGPLPFYEQFFVGGVDSMRGYRESRFWGRYFFLADAEFRWPLTRSLIGLLLADLGDAWGSEYQIAPGVQTDYGQHVKFAPRGSYGIGLWYVLPQFGLMRLIYAKGEDWRFGFAVGESY